MKKVYSFRRIFFETVSAIHPGSGESDPVLDMPVQTDDNGLPTINATSIAGVIRHLYGPDASTLFGDVEKKAGGSRFILSNAIILDENSNPVESLQTEKVSNFLSGIQKLNRRDHCAINEFGSAKTHAKFDQTVLMGGLRFVFEYHIIADTVENGKMEADKIAGIVSSPEFRIGGGTRDGFGQIKVLKISGREYDLNLSADLEAFLKRSASLEITPDEPDLPLPAQSQTTTLRITLTPEDFWLSSDGTGFMNLQIYPKQEDKIVWENGKPVTKTFAILPATSIKGALAHRTAYFYNKHRAFFADQQTKEEMAEPNPAVLKLFGMAKDSNASGATGHVLISDIYCSDAGEKVFNHVKIDRFTGGALDAALFTEMVNFGGTLNLNITEIPFKDDDPENQAYWDAFHAALNDLQTGMLPLGGGTMRGLGTMKKTESEE